MTTDISTIIDDLFEQGPTLRYQVLGAAYVDKLLRQGRCTARTHAATEKAIVMLHVSGRFRT